MTARALTIGLVQMAMGDDPAENLARARAGVEAAARDGAGLICLPELFRTHYFPRAEREAAFELAEPLPGPTTRALGEVARKHGITILAPLFERRAAGLYHNTVAAIGPDGDVSGLYRKMHIPDDPGYYEKYYFTPGDLGFRAFDAAGARIGALVCWDQWFPEAARLTALAGAQILFYPTAIGWHPGEKAEYGDAQLAAWQTMQKSHAIANGVFVCAVNRVGHEGPKDGGLEFWGHSFVCDPFGTVIAEAGQGEETLVVKCDLEKQEEVRRGWPFLRDRRIDAYGDLLKRFRD